MYSEILTAECYFDPLFILIRVEFDSIRKEADFAPCTDSSLNPLIHLKDVIEKHLPFIEKCCESTERPAPHVYSALNIVISESSVMNRTPCDLLT